MAVLALGAGDFPSFARAQAAPAHRRTGPGLEAGLGPRRGGDGRRRLGGRLRRLRLASGPADARRPSCETLQDDGVYPDLYVGTNLRDDVPQDLYRQDWWYRTTFTAPAGHSNYTLQFPGINYRAEIWLNGQLLADSNQIVGMYVAHDLDVTRWIRPGAAEHAWRSR